MTPNPKIPEGFLEDIKGRFVPISTIPQVDLLRDGLVRALVGTAMEHQQALIEFKEEVFSQIEAFLAEAAKLGKVKVKGQRGNFTLFSFDGAFKITVQNQEKIGFNESLQLAKDQLLKCVNRWSEGADENLQALVQQAFEPLDQQGNVSVSRILSLRRIRIEDRGWKKGIELLTQSMQAVGSKRYVRFYVRDEHGAYQPVSLDLAAL